MNYRQDLPPEGGYPGFRTTRNLPKRGPSGITMMFGAAAIMAFGFFLLGKSNRQRRWGLRSAS